MAKVTKNGCVKDVPDSKLNGKNNFIGFLDAGWKLLETEKKAQPANAVEQEEKKRGK